MFLKNFDFVAWVSENAADADAEYSFGAEYTLGAHCTHTAPLRSHPNSREGGGGGGCVTSYTDTLLPHTKNKASF